MLLKTFISKYGSIQDESILFTHKIEIIEFKILNKGLSIQYNKIRNNMINLKYGNTMIDFQNGDPSIKFTMIQDERPLEYVKDNFEINIHFFPASDINMYAIDIKNLYIKFRIDNNYNTIEDKFTNIQEITNAMLKI